MSKTMRFENMLAVLLCCLLLTSCGTAGSRDTDTQIPNDTVSVAAETFPWLECMDAGDYVGMNELYMAWSQTGNPDVYENAVPYESADAGDVLQFERMETYSLADEYWCLKITPAVPNDRRIRAWGHLLNLEKWENGTWVRQCVLWDDDVYWQRTDEPPANLIPQSAMLGDSDFRIEVARIYDTPQPGQYRFVFYVEIAEDDTVEYRKYHIPFEVVG